MPYASAFLLGWLLCILTVVNGDVNATEYNIDVFPPGTDHVIYKVVYTFNDAFPLRRLIPNGFPSLVIAIERDSKKEEDILGDKDIDLALPMFDYISRRPGMQRTKTQYNLDAALALDLDKRLTWTEQRVVIRTLNDYRSKYSDDLAKQFGPNLPGAVISVWKVGSSGSFIKVANGFVTVVDATSQDEDSKEPLRVEGSEQTS